LSATVNKFLHVNGLGHKTYKPKYGKGPSLELKLKYLQQIAFKAPTLE
jgi:hypothetical protein